MQASRKGGATNHTRNQVFVWECTFFPEKKLTTFLVVALKTC